MQWIPETLATDSTRWWQETYELYYEELQEKLKAYLAKAIENKEGCLELGSNSAPTEVQWRAHKLRVYQLVAWGSVGEIPIRGRVVRHLCNNRACINPDHLRIGSQAENLADQRTQRALKAMQYPSHLE
jgi:hypothetical protein